MASAEYMRQWRADNPERARVISRLSKEKHQEHNREYQRKWAARWRAANPDLAKEIAHRYSQKHVERLRKKSRTRYYSDVEKAREYARTLFAEKRKWVADIKLASGCVDCGFKAHPDALHFDHLPQYEKAFNIGPSRSFSKQRILDEINKCEVRCANCHAIKTAERRQKTGSQ